MCQYPMIIFGKGEYTMSFYMLKQPINHMQKVYRGTARNTPLYKNFEESHPINQAFYHFLDIANAGLQIRDSELDKARQLVKHYAQLEPPQYYDLVETVEGQATPTASNSRLLGYDLALGLNSLLETGLNISPPNLDKIQPDDPFRVIIPLLRLIQYTFQPQLNEYGLFDRYETAAFCLECMSALQKIHSNLFEDPSVIFQVTGIWLLPLE